jgi:hypothetical protein
LIQYDTENGGSHGGIVAGGTSSVSYGFESMRTWSDWQAHTGPIAIGGRTSLRGHTGLVMQPDNGNLTVGAFLGRGTDLPGGLGGFVTIGPNCSR